MDFFPFECVCVMETTTTSRMKHARTIKDLLTTTTTGEPLGLRRDESVVGPGANSMKQLPEVGPFDKNWMQIWHENYERLTQNANYRFVVKVAGLTDRTVTYYLTIEETRQQWQRASEQAQAQRLRIERSQLSLPEITKQIEQIDKEVNLLEARSSEAVEQFTFLSNMIYTFWGTDSATIKGKISESTMAVNKLLEDIKDKRTLEGMDATGLAASLADITPTNNPLAITTVPTREEDLLLLQYFLRLFSEINASLVNNDFPDADQLLSKVTFILYFGETIKEEVDRMVKDYGTPIPYPPFFFQGKIKFVRLDPQSYFLLLQYWFYSNGQPGRDMRNEDLKVKVEECFTKVTTSAGPPPVVQWQFNIKGNLNFQVIASQLIDPAKRYPFFLRRVGTGGGVGATSSIQEFIWSQWSVLFFHTYYDVVVVQRQAEENLRKLEAKKVDILTGAENLDRPQFPYEPSLQWVSSPIQSGMAVLTAEFSSALDRALADVLNYCLRYWTDRPDDYLNDRSLQDQLLDQLTTNEVVCNDFALLVSTQLFQIGSQFPKRYSTITQTERGKFDHMQAVKTLQAYYAIKETSPITIYRVSSAVTKRRYEQG